MSLIVDIEKQLGDFHLRTQVEAGNETIALLGASGCGKSMTLKCIAGIVRPDSGHIEVDGVTLFDSKKGICLSPQQRRTGLLFQNYALFPNMTVRQNILCGARREKDKALRAERVSSLMNSFGLTPLASRYPAQLSGGQQQRAALARILVSDPHILLLDEPFSALDSHLRFRLEREVKQVIRDFGKTVVLVSHDRDEVFRLSDRIAVMDAGHIVSQGTRHEVFANPGTAAGAALTGCKNVSPFELRPDGTVYASSWGISLTLGESSEGFTAVGIRMHDIRFGEGENSIVCEIIEEIENPFSVTVMLHPEGAREGASIGWELDKKEWESVRGETVRIRLPRESLMLLKE